MNNDISKKDKILSIAILSYFLGTIIAIVAVAGMKLPTQYLIMLFAQVFLVVGIICLYCSPKKDNNVIEMKGKKLLQFPIGWLLIFVGVIGIAAPVVTLLGVEEGPVIMYSASLGFIAMGVLEIGGYITNKKRALKICTYSITANVIGHEEHITEHRDEDGRYHSHTYRCETFEYEYLGKKFVYQSNGESHLRIGDTKIIYIDPNNPEVAFDISKNKELGIAFFSLGSIVGGAFMLICALSNL